MDGGSGDDTIVLRKNPGPPDVIEVDTDGDGTADFTFPRAAVTSILVKAGSGDDTVTISDAGGAFTDTIPTTIDGGSGDDRLIGGAGNETFIGDSGNDFVDGNRGNDTAELDSGSDTFQWDPGDGSDTIEGGTGNDTMLFNGSNAAEHFDLSANGHRLRFFRDVASITMDTDGVEQVDINALGSADVTTVNDLAATDVTRVNVDLNGFGGSGDGAVDQVIANGTAANDTVNVTTDGAGGLAATGLAATIDVLNPELTDQLVVNGLGGANRLNVNGTPGDDSFTLGGNSTAVNIQGLGGTITQPAAATDQLFVNGLGGNDKVSGNGQAPVTTQITIDGGPGDDNLGGTSTPTCCSAATATTSSTATAATTPRSSGTATTRSSGIPATAATSSRARPATTGCCSTAPTRPRRWTCRRTATGCASRVTSPPSSWTRTTSSRSTSTRSGASTRSPSTTSRRPTSRR